MNKEDPNKNGDEFERQLETFRRSGPPAEWRDEMIANAVPSSSQGADPTKPDVLLGTEERPRGLLGFSFPEMIFGGGLAAAWLVIIGFWIATPNLGEEAESAPVHVLRDQTINNYPMLAWRSVSEEMGATLFK